MAIGITKFAHEDKPVVGNLFSDGHLGPARSNTHLSRKYTRHIDRSKTSATGATVMGEAASKQAFSQCDLNFDA